jgi:Spy/CpxP family protein refolding chaperone
MKKRLCILAGLAVLSIVAAPLHSAERKAVEPAPARVKPDKEDPFAGAAAFGENLEDLDAKVTLTEEQKTKLKKLMETRDKTLAKFDKAYESRVQKAEERLSALRSRGEKNNRQVQNMRKQLEGFLKSVETKRSTLEGGYEKRMFALLKPEQRAKWNHPILQDALTKEFSLLFLDTKQEERLESLCKAQAKRLSVPLDPEKHAKSLEGLQMMVYRSILNKKQQLEYRKMKAAMVKKPGREGGRRRGGRGR